MLVIFGYDLGWGGMPSKLSDLCTPCLEEISVLSAKRWFDYIYMYVVMPAIMMCSLTKKWNILDGDEGLFWSNICLFNEVFFQ